MKQEICAVAGCDRLVSAKGLCKLHYNRQYYLIHREQICAQVKEYRETYKEELKKKRDAFRGKHPEILAERKRIWYLKNQDRLKRKSSINYAANIERNREWARKYRENHKKELAASKLAYRLAHKSEQLERVRLWRLKNPDRFKAQLKRYALKYPDKIWAKARVNTQRRRARANLVMNNLSKEYISEILGHGCFFLTLGDCEGPLSIAHDIPISNGGNTTLGNVFCLCRKHNSMMHTQSLAEMLDQLELL